MQIPTNTKTYAMRTSIIWFDEDGIVYSTPKPGAPQQSTNEEIKADVEAFRKLVDNRKVCMVLESDPNTAAPPKHQRDLIDQELHSVLKVLAIITTSALSKMIVNLFFTIKPPAYPTKLFTDVDEAVKWAKDTCKKIDSDNNSKGNLMVA
jgi:hypothetical protein